MSVEGNKIDAELERALDAFAVPPLPADFADRVLAKAMAAQPLAAPLPRRPARTGGARWMPGRRIGLGLVAGAMLSATAAAAAGVFGDIGVTIPALRSFAERIALVEPAPPVPAAQPRRAPPPVATAPAPTEAVPVPGTVTPEALEARFRAQDERRTERRAAVTRRIETAVDERVARRQAAGLPVASPEQRARVRDRIEARVAERDTATAARREVQRDALREVVRERQAEPPTPAPPAALPAAPAEPSPAAAEPAATEDADTPAAQRRTALTPAQREALRQRRQQRLERLRQLRRQQ